MVCILSTSKIFRHISLLALIPVFYGCISGNQGSGSTPKISSSIIKNISNSDTTSKTDFPKTSDASCYFSGSVVPHGSTVKAFKEAIAPSPKVCESEQRTCSYGVLSGSYVYKACDEKETPAPAPIPETPSQLTFSIKNLFAFAGAWAANIISTYTYAVPIGWGYMDPMVAVVGNDFYVPSFFPCDEANRAVYCLVVMKNGKESITTNPHFLGYGGIPAIEAYQTPSIFFHSSGTLLAVYWYIDNQYVSTIVIDGVNLNLPVAERTWVRLGTYSTPGRTINYIGSAMARDGTIFIAGWGGGGSLTLLRALPNFSYIEEQGLAFYSAPSFQPLYPHVVVKNDGRVNVLYTLSNGNPCPAYGYAFTTYKQVAQLEGYWGGAFSTVLTSSPSDAMALPGSNGNNCAWNSSRFPMDLIYSPKDNATYSVVRVSDVPNLDPNINSIPPTYTQKYTIWKNGTVVAEDVSPAFKDLFATGVDIHSVSLSQLNNGTFVLIANNRSTLDPLGIVTTKDFKNFSKLQQVSSPYGTGHKVFIGQGYKNTDQGVDRAVFFYGGRLNDSWLSLPNYHLQFKGGVVTVP